MKEIEEILKEIKDLCDGNITKENNIWHKVNRIESLLKKQMGDLKAPCRIKEKNYE